MTDIVERLRFDEARCETQFSKGVAENIKEARAEIERLRRAGFGGLSYDIAEKQRQEIERLHGALKDMFALIDEGWLVRNTANDAASDWAIRQLGFVRRLQKAQAALTQDDKAGAK